MDARSGFQLERGIGHNQGYEDADRVDGAVRRAFAIGRLAVVTPMPRTGIEAPYR